MSRRLWNPSNIDGGRKASMPKEPKPQLATLVDDVPKSKNWYHEWKLDGYRMLCRKEDNEVTMLTRRSKDWTDRFVSIAEEAQTMDADFILDGEMVVIDEKGLSNFQRLQNALKGKENKKILYVVFDLLYLNGYDLTKSPLSERKEALISLLDTKGGSLDRIRLSEHREGKGSDMLEEACRKGMEGIISKRADSRYSGKRDKSWQKIKCLHEQEFLIGGYTRPKNSRKGLGSIMVGYHDEQGDVIYTGKVGTGFTDRELEELSGLFSSRERKTSPFKNPPKEKDLASWITPDLVCQVKFEEWTKDGKLRQPAYLGLREDKDPEDIRREGKEHSANPGGGNRENTDPKVTHPGKILFPDPKISKGDLAEYYESIGERILPFIQDRPLSIVRCPSGRQKNCFFQKHVKESMGEGIKPVKVPGDNQEYISAVTTRGLISLVQLGTLEIHPWGSRSDKLDSPDFIVFDIDPGEGAGWDMVKDAAREMKDLMDQLGLESFLKTSGGKGLHVYVPIQRRSEWKEVRDFSHAVSTRMKNRDPEKYIDTMSKEKRKGKIFIDYLRNSQGSTSVAPYSTRAKPGAPISVPLQWDELSSLDDSAQYTVKNINSRLSRLKQDPWDDYLKTNQSITKEIMEKALSE
ncbi:MAG: DNA ligase D [Spirochaetia bacterium]